MSALLPRGFKHRSKTFLLQLYMAFGRLHLEHCIVFVSLLQKGCMCHRGSLTKIHLAASKDGRITIYGQNIQNSYSLSG